jgi:hypothetical protein
MFETIAVLIAAGVTLQVIAWTVASVLYPVFCIWMGIDALLRNECDYPTGSSNEKLVWILGIIFVHPMAILYFFLVHQNRRRSVAPAAAQSYTVA